MVSISQANRIRRGGSVVAHFATENGQAYALAYGPEQFAVTGLTPVFAEVARPGRKPLLLQDALQLRGLTFSHSVVAGPGVNVKATIALLIGLSVSGRKVRLIGIDPVVRGWYHILDLQVKITAFTEAQSPKTAELSWTLKEASIAPVKLGRKVPALTAAQLQRASDTRTPATSDGALPSVGYFIGGTDGVPKYAVHQGDTLRSIAEFQLGDASRWTEIADLNKAALKAASEAQKSLIDDTPIQYAGPDSDGSPVPRRSIVGLPPGMVLVMPAVTVAPSVGTPTPAPSGQQRGGSGGLPMRII